MFASAGLRVPADPFAACDAELLLNERDFGTVRRLIADYAGIKLNVTAKLTGSLTAN